MANLGTASDIPRTELEPLVGAVSLLGGSAGSIATLLDTENISKPTLPCQFALTRDLRTI
jgi:hypothetical protein